MGVIERLKSPITRLSHNETATSNISGELSQLVKHVDDSGFTRASLTYAWYHAHWFRDAAMAVHALTDTADFFNGSNNRKAKLAQDAAGRIINFTWDTIAKYKDGINNALSLDPESEEFKLLKNHLPARVSKYGNYFACIRDGRPYTDQIEDDKDSWLRQYDSIPLSIIATEKFINSFGISALSQKTKSNIKGMLRASIKYMLKTYNAPGANAWELDWDEVHAYTAASISKGLRSAADIADRLGVYIGDLGDLQEKADGIDRFIEKSFVREGVLYKSAKATGNGTTAEPNLSVDSSEIFIFSMFRPKLSKEVEENTVRAMEKELFDGNVLPIRYQKDPYFFGGRWLLLGLEFARYYSRNGRQEDAKRILDYVNEKYIKQDFSLPEQELVNPANLDDPDHYFERNGSSMIRELGWSEAEYLRAAIAYSRNQAAESQRNVLAATARN